MRRLANIDIGAHKTQIPLHIFAAHTSMLDTPHRYIAGNICMQMRKTERTYKYYIQTKTPRHAYMHHQIITHSLARNTRAIFHVRFSSTYVYYTLRFSTPSICRKTQKYGIDAIVVALYDFPRFRIASLNNVVVVCVAPHVLAVCCSCDVILRRRRCVSCVKINTQPTSTVKAPHYSRATQEYQHHSVAYTIDTHSHTFSLVYHIIPTYRYKPGKS